MLQHTHDRRQLSHRLAALADYQRQRAEDGQQGGKDRAGRPEDLQHLPALLDERKHGVLPTRDLHREVGHLEAELLHSAPVLGQAFVPRAVHGCHAAGRGLDTLKLPLELLHRSAALVLGSQYEICAFIYHRETPDPVLWRSMQPMCISRQVTKT